MGCHLPTDSQERAIFQDREQMHPSYLYDGWYNELENCLDTKEKKYHKINWYKASSIVYDGKTAYGLIEGNEITIRDDHSEDTGVVKHEMMHSLVGINHTDAPYDVWIKCTGFEFLK